MTKLKKIKPYVINSAIILSLFLITLVVNKLYPFGDFSLARFDAYHQYQPFLYNFITNIKEGTLLKYTFITGFGQPFIFNFLYYLASPLNLIAILFKDANAMYLSVILIKVIITGILTTFYSLKRTNNTYLSTIIAISYTYSGWFLANYFHIMWLDAFMIFPLFQYGLEELSNNNNPKIYIISLAYILISNFYIAFMVCLYTFVSYLFNLIIKKDKYINKIKNFQLIMFTTLFAFLISAFHIYATYDTFLKMGIPINNISHNQTNLTIFNLLQSFFSGNIIINLSSFEPTSPNIALSLIFTISLIYYFFNKEITKKEKIKNLITFIFIIILLYSKTLNYIINCFHVPAGYNYRYSFLITFFFIKLFIDNYKTFENKIDKKIYFINTILLIILIILYAFNDMELKTFIYNLSFLIAYTIFFVFYNNQKTHKILFVALVTTEVLISLILNINSTLLKTNIEEFNTEYITYRDNSFIQNNDTNYNIQLYSNIPAYHNFSSMQYNFLYTDYKSIGIRTDNKAFVYKTEVPDLTYLLFNIKDNDKNYLEKIYAVNNTLYKEPTLPNESTLDNLNSITEKMTGIKNVLIKHTIPYKKVDKNKYTYKIPETNTYYLYINYSPIEEIITNNVTLANSELSQSDQHILKLEKDEIITIIYEEKPTDENLTIYTQDDEKLLEVYNTLKDHQINYTTYKDNHLEGTIKVEENQIIFTSIPYDESWQIMVDGKEVKPIRLLNSLMGFECESGTHTISLKYKSEFTIPAIISITSLTIFIGICIYTRKKND